jgi:hypothetical protein
MCAFSSKLADSDVLIWIIEKSLRSRVTSPDGVNWSSELHNPGELLLRVNRLRARSAEEKCFAEMVYLLQQVALSCTLCHIDQPDSAFLPGSTLVCRAPRPVG